MNTVEKTVKIEQGGNGPPVVQRDDGLWSIGWHDCAAGPFNSRLDALRIANGDAPMPAPVAKFRRIKIREVRGDA